MKHFLSILDLTPREAAQLILRADELKRGRIHTKLLNGKTVILIFEKASTRTRVSFEVGVRQLGGYPIFLSSADSQLGRSEPLEDTARVLSRYCDAMVVRTFGQHKLETLAKFGSIPVINALSDQFHPCQVMSDLLAIYERTPDFSALRVAWVGDGNNMAHSWINAAVRFPFTMALACPKGYQPDPAIVAKARELGAKVELYEEPADAIRGAHYVNTDVWASMGQESEQREREKAFKGYCVSEELMALGAPDCKFLHCLPAHRGEEVTEEVFEGPRSIVFDEAENRLHMQKAIIEWVFDALPDMAGAEKLCR